MNLKNLKGKKQLEKAIVLGLVLSTGVCGSAWAETTIDAIDNDTKDTKFEYSDNIVVRDGEKGNIVFDDENKGSHTAFITTTGDNQTITLNGDGTGIWIADKVASGTVVVLTATGDINITTTGNNAFGIQANSANEGSKITLTAGGSNNITTDNIAVYGIGKVDVELIAAENNIKSNGKYNAKNKFAVKTDENSEGVLNIIATEGNNTITAEKGTAVRANGKKVITIQAAGDNIIIGDVNGIQHNETGNLVKDADTKYLIVTAQNNVVYGGTNAVISNGTGIVDVVATEGDNTIGRYTEGNNTYTSNTGINVSEGTFNSTAEKGDNNIYATTYGVLATGGSVNVTAEEGSNKIDVKQSGSASGTGITVTGKNNATVTLDAAQNNDIIAAKGINATGEGNMVTLTAGGNNNITAKTNGIIAWTKAKVELQGANNTVLADTSTAIESRANADVNLIAAGNNTVDGGLYGLNATYGGKITLDGKMNAVNGDQTGILSRTSYNGSISNIEVKATDSNQVTSKEYGIEASNSGNVLVTAATGNNIINSDYCGAIADEYGNVEMTAGTSNLITGDYSAVISYGYSNVNMTAETGNNELVSVGTGDGYALETGANSVAHLKADKGNNILKADALGIYAYSGSDVLLDAVNNAVRAGEEIADENEIVYGDSYAIVAHTGTNYGNTVVNLGADNTNQILGAVYASGSTDTSKASVTMDGAANIVRSAAVIEDAGDLTDKTVISALYAEDGGWINVSGANDIRTYADSESEDLERTVWAYDGAHINIDGATTISTNSYEKSHNSNDIAIVAGTATELDEDDFTLQAFMNMEDSIVNINYKDYDGGVHSYIAGDIVSGYSGYIDIKAADDKSGLDITGNLLAGNDGILNVDLGEGGKLTGRIDDYADAGTGTGHGTNFFNPAFSSNIITRGGVNLTMGNNSVWNVTGQSWVSSINTEGAENTVIDLSHIGDGETLNANSSALTVGNFQGDTTFIMNLTGERKYTDMLYFGQANGKYIINLENPVTAEDISYDKSTGMEFDRLRFATVGSGDVEFVVQYKGRTTFNDVTYTVETDEYSTSEVNDIYNSTKADGKADQHRPGSDAVNNLVNSGIMTLEYQVDGSETQTNDTTLNYNLVNPKTSISDVGETILNMSRANYSNAVYMDRLNKRMGEARYINSEEDEGMWVRIRYDRIGKKDAYRSQNTMYELGYDQKQECDNGERRVGFAVDYMHGDTGYSDIAGKGEIDRYGLWLYDTWTGDKGHYADYIAKWGHLSNEFEIYTKMYGEKVTGDYSNNVFSISAEYGRKKDMGSDWYFEPQAQLQLARVTGADYATDQGTKVSVDGINSLIGRAGFRLGKDFGTEKQSTVYVKADVLHEFLGDQDIRALDNTTNGWQTVSYENEGTWYDFGIGFATMMSKSSYAFLDLERSFGHDNDETWQINAGVQWSF